MTLINALKLAVKTCCETIDEEEGGIIMVRDNDYKFVRLENNLKGTPIAKSLISFETEYGTKIIPMFKERWRCYASFHTHPRFPCYASSIDYDNLFNGFRHNYIYSRCNKNISHYEKKKMQNMVDLKEINNIHG